MSPLHNPLRPLYALLRYFFVSAPSREAGTQQVREEANKMREALDRLDNELIRLDGALRPVHRSEPRK